MEVVPVIYKIKPDENYVTICKITSIFNLRWNSIRLVFNEVPENLKYWALISFQYLYKKSQFQPMHAEQPYQEVAS